MAYYRTV